MFDFFKKFINTQNVSPKEKLNINNKTPNYSNPFSGDFPTPPLEESVSRNLKGIELEKEGSTEESIELYEQNVADGFDGSHPYKRLAIIYRKQKRYDDEIRVLKKAIQVFSKLDRADAPGKLQYFKERLAKAQELKKR